MKHLHTKARYSALLVAVGIILGASQATADQKLTVYAAASLTNAVSEISSQYEKEHATRVIASFAASSALAKQIENGAPADVFISADQKWMNYLQDKQKLISTTRMNLLGNRLVVVAPRDHPFKLVAEKGYDFSRAFDGRLCTGDLDSVPAGIYAKQSLVALKWWDGIKSRIVGTQDVRAALAFVERGECAAGIVYETDAKVSGKVSIVGTLPDDSHDAIVYPVAVVAGSQPGAKAFLDYLSSPAAGSIFVKYGLSLIQHQK